MDADLAGLGRADAEQGQRKFRPSRVEKARDAEDLAAAQREADVLIAAGKRQIAHLKQRLVRQAGGLERLFLKFAAGHVVGEFFIVQLRRVARSRQLSAAENGKALRDFKDLVQLMTDKQNGDPLFLQLQNDAEKRLNLLPGQGGRRLIHDDEFRVEHQRTADGNHLFFRDRKFTQSGVQIDCEADPRNCLLRNRAHIFPVYKFLFCDQLTVDRQILHDAQVRKNGEVLINDLNAAFNGGKRRDLLQGPALKFDGTGIALINTGNNLDQRGLATAVFTGQAMDLARTDLQRNAVERFDAGKVFLDIQRPQ